MKRLFIPLALVLIFTLVSCAPAEAESGPSGSLPPVEVITPTPSPTPTATPEPTPYDGPLNPLSGLPIDEEQADLRPIAVVINNRKIALPQLGTLNADIIFEVPVEGAYTRMVAVFQDISKAGNVGSVRSARPYLIDIAQSFDSIFIHAGGSNAAYVQLKSNKVDRFDETNGPGSNIYFRDSDRRRTMGLEHSLLLSSEKVEEQIASQGYRREHESGYVPPLQFEDDLEVSGEVASSVAVKFNSSKTTSFEYDAANGLYKASQYGSEYVDGNTGEQHAFANLIIMKTAIKVIDSEGRLSVDLTSGGVGYFATGGEYVPISWSKSSGDSPFVFRDESGGKMTLRSGRTYIAIISNSAVVEFSEAI